jgi:hypothetical protein
MSRRCLEPVTVSAAPWKVMLCAMRGSLPAGLCALPFAEANVDWLEMLVLMLASALLQPLDAPVSGHLRSVMYSSTGRAVPSSTQRTWFSGDKTRRDLYLGGLLTHTHCSSATGVWEAYPAAGWWKPPSATPIGSFVELTQEFRDTLAERDFVGTEKLLGETVRKYVVKRSWKPSDATPERTSETTYWIRQDPHLPLVVKEQIFDDVVSEVTELNLGEAVEESRFVPPANLKVLREFVLPQEPFRITITHTWRFSEKDRKDFQLIYRFVGNGREVEMFEENAGVLQEPQLMSYEAAKGRLQGDLRIINMSHLKKSKENVRLLGYPTDELTGAQPSLPESVWITTVPRLGTICMRRETATDKWTRLIEVTELVIGK